MYHTKKIGVFISHIMGFYQQNVCQGIIDKALEYGYTAEIFASMDGENLGDYSIGEESILKIPNYDDFSGIIFASDTYPQDTLRQQIEATLKGKCSCPIIEISEKHESFPSISLENNSTTADLVRHLITAHKCRRICYLGCLSEAYFSDSRENYYRHTMEDAGLFVGEEDVYTASYTDDSVLAALKSFTSEGKPDAVICYNDHMALLFMEAALKNGYCIPQDFAITGCDNSEEGQSIDPCLTTVSFPVYELGQTAVECLIKKMKGDMLPVHMQVPANIVIGRSCGCMQAACKNPLFYQRSLLNRIDSTEASILSSMRMSAAFQNITDIDDGMDLLETYVRSIEYCHEFYLCLYDGWDSISKHILELTEQSDLQTGEPDAIHLKLAIRDGKRLPECSFTKSTLLPEHIYHNSDSAYLYMPLFFKNKEFGYVALAYEHNRINYHFQLVHWFMNINQMLQQICDAKNTNILVSHLEDIYTKDALTGLYNKHGYLHYEEAILNDAVANQKILTCFLFDLNNLKYINDTFGHNEGDFAIQVLGHALTSTTRSGDICARFSGDEFYVLSSNYTEEEAADLIARIHKYLNNYNKLSHKEYQITTSGGFAQRVPQAGFSQEDIKALYAEADKEMYIEKREAHATRV